VIMSSLDSRIRRWLSTKPPTVKALTEAECLAVAHERLMRSNPDIYVQQGEFATWLKVHGFMPRQYRTSAEYEPPRYGYRLNLGGEDIPDTPALPPEEAFHQTVRHWVGLRSLLPGARTFRAALPGEVEKQVVRAWQEDNPGNPAARFDVLASIAKAMGYSRVPDMRAAMRRANGEYVLELFLPAGSS
jgi:hypothetical protein